MTGFGGGIFLAPLVLSLGWATMQTAAISVVFNLMIPWQPSPGPWATLPLLPARLPLWLVCMGFGGTSRLLDRCLASQPPNIAIAASFPLAYGGRENDHCSFLRKHAVADEQPRRLRLTAARFELEAVLLAPPLR